MFGDILKELRTDSGLSQDQLAERFNISSTTISKYETGEREPDFKFLIEISNYFNVSTDYLLGKTKNPTPQYVISNLANHSPDTMRKLSIIFSKLQNRKYVDLVYSLFINIDNIK